MSPGWERPWYSHGANGTIVQITPGKEPLSVSCLRDTKGRVLSPRGGLIDRARYDTYGSVRRLDLSQMLRRYFQYAVIVGHGGDGFHDYIPVVVDEGRLLPYRDLKFCGYGIGFNCHRIKGDDFLRLQLGEPIVIPTDGQDLSQMLKRQADEARQAYDRWLETYR